MEQATVGAEPSAAKDQPGQQSRQPSLKRWHLSQSGGKSWLPRGSGRGGVQAGVGGGSSFMMLHDSVSRESMGGRVSPGKMG